MGESSARTSRWKLTGGDPAPSTTFLCVDSVRDDREIVVSVHGALDTAASHLIARQLLELLAEPIRTVTLQLDAVTFIDSSGIGVLTIARTNAHQRGIRFSLRTVPPTVRAVLRVAGMLDFFDLDGTRDDRTARARRAPRLSSPGSLRTLRPCCAEPAGSG